MPEPRTLSWKKHSSSRVSSAQGCRDSPTQRPSKNRNQHRKQLRDWKRSLHSFWNVTFRNENFLTGTWLCKNGKWKRRKIPGKEVVPPEVSTELVLMVERRGDFFFFLLFKMTMYGTHNFLSFLRCKATAIMPNSQGFYKDEIRSWIKQPEPTRCRLRTEHQAFPPAKRLTSPPATLRPKIKVMLREVINYSCHLWIVEATNAEIHRSQE